MNELSNQLGLVGKSISRSSSGYSMRKVLDMGMASREAHYANTDKLVPVTEDDTISDTGLLFAFKAFFAEKGKSLKITADNIAVTKGVKVTGESKLEIHKEAVKVWGAFGFLKNERDDYFVIIRLPNSEKLIAIK